MQEPETRYARAGDVHLAYQVAGEGPVDLVYVPTAIQQVEVLWQEPRVAAFFERLARFSRLILFDRRGTGLSDPIAGATTLEDQMEDVTAVMDAAGSRQAALLAQSEGAAMAMLYAATHPERIPTPTMRRCAAGSRAWRASARRSAMTSAGSPSTSARASARSPRPTRCSSPARCVTSSWDRASPSPIAASTSSGACPAGGICGPPRHPRT